MIRATMLACALGTLSLLAVAAGSDMPALELRSGMSLPAVLAAFREHGFPVVYSSALVREDMQLGELPRAASADEQLRALLAPWNLTVISDGRGDRLVVRSGSHRAADSTEFQAASGAIEAIDVTASRYGLATDIGPAVFFDRKDVQRTPHLADDPLRMLKLLPGVTGGDYSAALNVRGGRRDETSLVIDGAEIHNGFHFRDVDGFLSVLDTHLVQSTDFITGGMTADYGNYMSGVVDLTTFRPAPDDEYHSMLGISFVSAYGRTGGTFAGGDGSWLVAARRGYLDLVLSNAQPDNEQLTPRYSDVFASTVYDFSSDTSLSIHALLGSDDLRLVSSRDEDVDSAADGHSGHVWLTLDHRWSDTVRVHSLLSIARMDQTRNSSGADDERTGAVDSDFGFRFLDFRQDWSWRGGSQLLRVGFNANRQEADYDYHLIASIKDPTAPGDTIDIVRNTNLDATGERLGVYAAWRSHLTRNATAELGVRWDKFRYPNALSWDVTSPRINLLYAVGERGELRASWGVVYQPQGIDQLQVEDGLTDFSGPERSTQSVLAYTQRFGAGISARLDVYRKEYADQRPRFENALDPIELIPEATIDRIRIDAPFAEARGIELTLRREADTGFAGWASVAYAHVRDWIDDSWIPRSWEQELTVSFGASWTGLLWSVNFAGMYHTGTPVTALSAAGNGDGAVVVPEAYNSARLGPYSRIDLRVNRDVLTRAGRLSWYLEVTNLLDSRNPCCIEDFRIDPRNTSNVLIENGYWMPRLPSIGFQWEF